MSQSFAQFVPADSPRPALGVDRGISSAPRVHHAGEIARPIFQLEIRRSLQMHRRLTIGLALVGFALALIYLLNSWSIRTASDSMEPQPAHFSQVNESWLKGMTTPGLLRMGRSPGVPGFAASVVTPWYSANSGLIRNAIVLVLSFVFLGGAIAVVAHRADPRVYVAADVEQILGFPPMAQLPDFSEVADEVTDEHLLRLASGIELGFRDRGFKRFVLTGTAIEAGVTTVAGRLKNLLETMGRAVLIETAAANSKHAPRKTDPEPNRQPKLLEWVKEAGDIRAELVLVDAAPLADSEETERLVQSADCTLVILQSGATTRAQLRTVANILQRIKAPAVGFVLNRVHLATADPEFRRSIKEMGKQLRKQGQTTDWQMLQTLEQAIEEGRASLDLDALPSSDRLGKNRPEQIAASGQPIAELPDTTRPAPADQTGLSAQPDGRGLQIVKRALPEPTSRQDENPSPLAEIARQIDRSAESKAEQNEALPAAVSNVNGLGTSNAQASPAPEKAARVSLPRLSDLRGMRFSQAIRELDLAKHPTSPNAGIETLMNAIAPFEPMFTQMEPAQAKNDDAPQATPDEFDLPESLRGLIAISQGGVSREANGGVTADDMAAKGSKVNTNSLSPETPEQAKNEGRGDERERPWSDQSSARQKTGEPFEQLQILPSRRGQYKKKG